MNSIKTFFSSKLNFFKTRKNVVPPNHIYDAYNRARTIKDKKHLCHAPFNNMYFNSLGDVANCWLTFDDPERYSEEKTIKEIWFGDKFSRLRDNIKNFDLDSRCRTCKKYLENRNYVSVLAKAYDNDYPLGDYPTMMEFELSNTCNLECTMCTGLLSSSIRANRDKLPPLISPYGQKFVDELEEFIPHLHEARFNGGEPFLIKIYFDIWDRIRQLNPDCKIVVATNGTTLNSRVKEVMSKGNFHFNISIDSLIPERYAQIRVNGNLDKVLKNFDYFKTYCSDNHRNLCVMINPMRSNWEEMPAFVNFCNRHNVHLWFNTIMHPEDQGIWNLPQTKLSEIYQTLSSAVFTPCKSTASNIFKYNTATYVNLVEGQIKTWLREAGQKTKDAPVMAGRNENKKEVFFARLDDYTKASANGEEIKIKVRDMLGKMEGRIVYQTHIDAFYSLITEVPLDIVIDNMLKLDIDSAFEKFREYAKQNLDNVKN